MSEYGELKTNETLSEETTSFDIENGSKEKTFLEKKISLKKISILCCLFIVLLFVISYYVFIFTFIFSEPTPVSNVEEFNFTEDIIYSPPSANDLTASAIHHHSRFYKTCDDMKYGCCKIYSQCQIKNGYLDYKEHILDLHQITMSDRIGSNCYSLDHLVHKWNVEYKSENASETCDNSKYGCCPPINTACDFALRSKRGNNQETIDFYKQHHLHSHKVTVPKKDTEGSNCPSFGGLSVPSIVYAYNNEYPHPDDNGDVKFLIGVLCFVAWLLICGNIKCK